MHFYSPGYFDSAMATFSCLSMILMCVSFPHVMLQTSSYGTEFYIGMLPGYREDDYNITIDIASDTQGTFDVFVPFQLIDTSRTLNKGLTTFIVDGSLIRAGNFTERRGVYIKTSSPVSVYVTIADTSIETFLALPVTFTGKSYIVFSHFPQGNPEASVLMAVSTRNDTKVNIAGFMNTTLQRLDVQQISLTSLSSDLTGTIVSSNTPLTLVSGVSCSIVVYVYGEKIHKCDTILDQMIPTDAWTNTYVVAPVPPISAYVIKVMATTETRVCFSNTTSSYCQLIPEASAVENVFETEPTVVFSNDSIGVTQLGVSKGHYDHGGPFLTIVPGLENFLSRYNFIVPPKYSNITNRLTIVIRRADAHGLKLDEKSPNLGFSYNVTEPLEDYIVLISDIDTGYHTLSHQNPSVKFGAMLYGEKGNSHGYGFPAGIGKPIASTPSCYRCEDMNTLAVCDAIQHCSWNEMCFSEKYNSNSGTAFRSGCMDIDLCRQFNTSDTDVVCLECCSGNFCNNKGCGDDRFPARDERGPMCYDCQHILHDPNECTKVTMCRTDEVCSIEQHPWGDDFHYKMGCIHKLCTPLKRSFPVRDKRSTPICSSCCSEDFCNHNCTLTTGNHQGSDSVIVG